MIELTTKNLSSQSAMAELIVMTFKRILKLSLILGFLEVPKTVRLINFVFIS